MYLKQNKTVQRGAKNIGFRLLTLMSHWLKKVQLEKCGSNRIHEIKLKAGLR